MTTLRDKLKIPESALNALNDFLLDAARLHKSQRCDVIEFNI